MKKKVISAKIIQESLEQLCLKAHTQLPKSVKQSLIYAIKRERGLAKDFGDIILENIDIAKKRNLPLCQDTGYPEVFVTIGENVSIKGSLNQAIIKGVKLNMINRNIP